MDKNEMIEFLKSIELFKELNIDELTRFNEIVNVRKLCTGNILFTQNSPRDNMFIIYDGSVDLVKQGAYGIEKPLLTFVKNDFLAEGALMDNYPHSTTARVAEDSIILTVHRNDFNELMKENSQLVSKILSEISRVISRRMRQTTNQVVDAAAQYISGRTRKEHDLLGQREVPYEFYYGIQTFVL
jgi:aspartate ammonia-lyase